jgi:hypothetical protein
MTTSDEIERLLINGWGITDPSCNQLRKEIINCEKYAFREDRIINPVTKETELFEDELSINDYDRSELIDSCEAFGYSAKQVNEWLTEGEEIDLILECVFELSV